MVRLGGLWKNEDSKGTTYFSGNLGGGRLVLLPNKYKEKSNDPDYILYIKEKTS